MHTNSGNTQQSNILIVDDNWDNLHLLQSILTRQGHTVHMASDGISAFPQARATAPDLILLDILMPDMDGYAVCKQLKGHEDTRDIPVIFVSALHEAFNKARAFSLGGVDYITKPFQVAEVRARVATHLAMRHMHRQLQEQNARLQAEIEERKRTEEALRANQTLLRSIIDHAPVAVSVKDMAGRFVLVNRYLTDFLHLDEQDILGHSSQELDRFPQEKLLEWAQQDQHVYTTGARLDSEETYACDDELVTHLITRFPIADEQGMLFAMGSIEMDITERKHAEEQVRTLNTELEQRVWERTAQLVAANKELAHEISERKYTEEALRQSEVRFRTLTETADAAILIYQDECFRYANVTAEVTTGYSRDELQHMRLDDLLHPDFTLPFRERTWRIRSGTQVPARYELKIRTHEARERWLTLSVAVIGYDDRPALLLTATDITERKRAEEALRQGEVRFRTLTETADAAILIYQDECFRYANVTAEVTTGYSRDELQHMRLDDLLHPDFTLPFQERTWRIRSGTQVPARYELKIRTHEARERWLTLSVAVIGYDDRPALLLTATDITARKQAEEALRASEERYRTLVETAPSAVLLTDIDYTIRFCNQQAARLFAYERIEDIIGKKGTDLITSELSDDPLVQIRTIALLGNSGTLEYELERSDGSTFIAEIMSAAIITPQGVPMGLTIVINDISARKQAERELADTYEKLARMNTILMRSRNLLRAIVDNLDDGLLLLDGGGIIQEANRPLAALLDSKPSEMVGQRWNSLYPRIAPGFPGELSSDTTLQKHAQWRQRYHRSDGTTHILDFQSIALYGSDQNVELLILRVTDATEHVQLQALVMENERFAASGRLAASVAHEINTPLQALQSYLHLAQVAPDADRAAFLSDAMQEIQRVGRIVRQFLDLYRPSAAEHGRVDINKLLERILLLLGKRLRDQGVQVERSLAADLPRPEGRADEVMQVLLNLMVNALDAMPDGGLLRVQTEAHHNSLPNSLPLLPDAAVATTTATAAAEEDASDNASDAEQGNPQSPPAGQHILVAISDTGHGISPEFQARIFEPFITTKEEGTGLGLAISSQIIQQHGGHIGVESQQGAGSTFRILLPYTPEEEETEEQAP